MKIRNFASDRRTPRYLHVIHASTSGASTKTMRKNGTNNAMTDLSVELA